MSDTPETDELELKWAGDPIATGYREALEDLSRKLERERDDARRVAETVRNEWADERGSPTQGYKLPWET